MSSKLRYILLTLISVIVLSACGHQSNTYEKKAPVELKVSLQAPAKANVNEDVLLEALVTQGNEKVKDADEVKYQIWEGDDTKNSKYVNAKNEKNGKYSAKTVFDHVGTYQVQVHVTARQQHVMPKMTIVVGDSKTN